MPLSESRFALGLRSEGDRTADLQDHVRHGHLQLAQQLVELREPLGPLAVFLAHVQVQHGGAGIVAVHRLLHVLLHGDRQVLGEVRRQPLRPVGRGGDDEVLLVLGEQGVVEEVHPTFSRKAFRFMGL